MRGKVLSLDEALEKGEDSKLTKEESEQWLIVRIAEMGKRIIHVFSNDKKGITPVEVAGKIFADLVSDWPDNRMLLEACRAVKLDRDYVLGQVSGLFDADGKPRECEIGGSSGCDSGCAKEPATGQADPRTYYASLVSMDEALELKKARTKG